MSGKIIAIVQARMGSSRFPGKMMAELCGRPLMEWVLRRCAAANSLDGVVLATTDLEQDDILAATAADLDLPAYRGSSADVLGRYAAEIMERWRASRFAGAIDVHE